MKASKKNDIFNDFYLNLSACFSLLSLAFILFVIAFEVHFSRHYCFQWSWSCQEWFQSVKRDFEINFSKASWQGHDCFPVLLSMTKAMEFKFFVFHLDFDKLVCLALTSNYVVLWIQVESKQTKLLSCCHCFHSSVVAFDDESNEIQVFCISSCFRQFNLPCINI